MSKSFTEFRGYGFWAQDSALEVWLYVLASEIGKSTDQPDWLRSARKDWHLKATVGFMGWICANLDEHLTSTDRLDVTVRLSNQALAWFHEQGPLISAEVLNSFRVGGEGAYFTRDVETDNFIRVGETFVQLLEGKLKTDATTSPVFP
jgi:hypothetical protein